MPHQRHRLLFVLILGLQIAGGTSLRAQSVPFFVPGDDASKTVTDFSGLHHKPAGSKGFVSVRDGKFYVGSQRLRFWGMNLCFGANFPTHAEADKVAPHLAKLGINAIRFHHMDMLDAPGGIWKTQTDGTRILDPEQLDKFDYFIAKLAEHGIYSNINLHVSRTLTEAEGFPQIKDGPWWSSFNKWVMYYDPDVQSQVKEFCRQLLNRKNKYRRGIELTDDPAIAVYEMLNENFFSRQGVGFYQVLPPKFARSFRTAWNNWLKKRYRNDQALRKAWTPQDGAGKTLIEADSWASDLGDWQFNSTQAQLRPTFKTGPSAAKGCVRIEPPAVSEQRHSQQLAMHGLTIEKGKPYSLSFWVRSDSARETNIEVSTTQGGTWRSLGLLEVIKSKSDWQQIKRTFIPEESINENAYVAFSFGDDVVPLEIAGVELRQGMAQQQLPSSQNLEDRGIDVPDDRFPVAAHIDLKQFMLDTEKAWVLELKDFLINECGVKVPITASQENYHGSRVLKETVDFVDLHNYWHHPLFTGGIEWSPTNYTVGNVPMESYPLQENWPARSLIIRTGWRYHGMPFTLSEWNHADPSDVNTGAIMMAAVVGRLQDWDGVYFFDYESSHGDWFRDHYEGFFDFNGQPAKLAVLSAASNIFNRGDLKPLQAVRRGTDEQRLDGRLAFQYKLGVDFDIKQPDEVVVPDSMKFATPTESVIWDATDPESGYLRLNTPKTRGAWGLVGGRKFEIDGVEFDVQQVDRNYATMLVTSQDNRPIEQSKRLLVLASSGAENTAMGWNHERNSVGDDWGKAPTLVNVVTATVRLPLQSCQVFALDGTGKRMSKVVASSLEGTTEFQIGPQYKTIWYEVVVE